MMLINAGMLFLGMLLVKSKKIDMLSTLCGTEAGDQRGGECEPIKISSEIQTVGLYPENHPSLKRSGQSLE